MGTRKEPAVENIGGKPCKAMGDAQQALLQAQLDLGGKPCRAASAEAIGGKPCRDAAEKK
jgi:hypothetical protein